MEIKMRLFFSLKGFGSRQTRKQHPHRPSSTPSARHHLGNRTEIFFVSCAFIRIRRGSAARDFQLWAVFCALRPSGEKWMKIAIRNQATSFPSFFSPERSISGTFDLPEPRDLRLSIREIGNYWFRVLLAPIRIIFGIHHSHYEEPCQNFSSSRASRSFTNKNNKTVTHFPSHHSLSSNLRYLPFFCEIKFR